MRDMVPFVLRMPRLKSIHLLTHHDLESTLTPLQSLSLDCISIAGRFTGQNHYGAILTVTRSSWNLILRDLETLAQTNLRQLEIFILADMPTEPMSWYFNNMKQLIESFDWMKLAVVLQRYPLLEVIQLVIDEKYPIMWALSRLQSAILEYLPESIAPLLRITSYKKYVGPFARHLSF